MLNKGTNLSAYAEYLGLGIQIAVSMVAPLLTGIWADNRWDTAPWFTLAGVFLGIFITSGIILKIALLTSKSGYKKQNRNAGNTKQSNPGK